jgi:hypothetical protein
MSSAAPVAETTVPAPVVPRGVFIPPPVAPSLSVPALIVVKPEYVFDPESISVPVPLLVTAPVPLMIPAYAEGLVLSLPIVRVAAPRVTFPPVPPPPVSEPIVLLSPV